jgi:hypothetical protein
MLLRKWFHDLKLKNERVSSGKISHHGDDASSGQVMAFIRQVQQNLAG